MRERYYVAVSVAYIILGVTIVVRSAMAQVPIVGILGVVFVALGVVRLRDLSAHRKRV